MSLLPTITFGGGTFTNIAGIVGPDFAQRPDTVGLAIHHSVTGDAQIDANMDGTTEDEEIALIEAINAYHRDVNGWGCGFGYNAAVAQSGRVYVVGPCLGKRAHVASRNHELAGIVMLGDFSTTEPSSEALAGAGRWVLAMDAMLSATLPVWGHRTWATATSPTSCPGDGGDLAVPEIAKYKELAMPTDQDPLADPAVEARIWAVVNYRLSHVLRQQAAALIDMAKELEVPKL